MVVPMIRGNLSVECQLEAVGALLIDHESDDQSWVIDWISQDITPKENGLLRDLVSHVRQT